MTTKVQTKWGVVACKGHPINTKLQDRKKYKGVQIGCAGYTKE